MSELVRTLSQGLHPVELSLRPRQSVEILKECIDRKYVHVKFTDTRGGTELGVPLNLSATDLSKADLTNGSGEAKFVGDLTLDYVKVRCIANIDIETFSGRGRLEILDNDPLPS